MFRIAGKRCRTILIALCIAVLTLVFCRDGTHKAHVPGKRRSMEQKNVLHQESNGGSGAGTPLSTAASENFNALERDTLMVGKFNGEANIHDNVFENYSRTKSNEDLNLKLEDKLKVNSVSTSKIAHAAKTTTTKTTTSSSFYPPSSTTSSTPKPKTILFYTKRSWIWAGKLNGNPSEMDHCPISTCIMLENSIRPEEADAVVFHVIDFNPESVPARRRPEQLYVWLSLEAPTWPVFGLPRPGRSYESLGRTPQTRKFGRPGFFNWTCTYHRLSDVMLSYGGLLPLEGEVDYVRPGLLKKSGAAYTKFLAALDRGDSLEDEAFLSRPKLVAWMVSHCKTPSGREHYVKELREHIQVDVYGSCGELKCNKKQRRWCYRDVLMPTYKFYLAFENSLCEDYATEKLWNPLHDGMVPVVYGGAQYSDILPPHSYVDATNLTPFQVANILSSIANSPQLYGRYHLWRKYWKVVLTPPLCELCMKLHGQVQVGSKRTLRHQSYHNLAEWWWNLNKCTTHYP